MQEPIPTGKFFTCANLRAIVVCSCVDSSIQSNIFAADLGSKPPTISFVEQELLKSL